VRRKRSRPRRRGLRAMEVNVLDRVRDRATPVALPAHRGADRKIPDQAPARGAGSISGRRGPRSFCSPNNPLITPGDQIVTRAKEGRKGRFFCGVLATIRKGRRLHLGFPSHATLGVCLTGSPPPPTALLSRFCAFFSRGQTDSVRNSADGFVPKGIFAQLRTTCFGGREAQSNPPSNFIGRTATLENNREVSLL
jgi:hypothetical protein